MKVITKWLVCVLKMDGSRVKNYVAELEGFRPSADQIEAYCKKNRCAIISMQRIRGWRLAFVFSGCRRKGEE